MTFLVGEGRHEWVVGGIISTTAPRRCFGKV
jgi:hypothetical protein